MAKRKFALIGQNIDSLIKDLTPQLGGDLDLNSNDITGTGDITITGAITATSYGGITEANLIDKTADETVSGDWLLTGADLTLADNTVLRLLDVSDSSLSSTVHPFQIGLTSGDNLIIDRNEIMARNNGSADQLSLNFDGGKVYCGGDLETAGYFRTPAYTTAELEDKDHAVNTDPGKVSGAHVFNTTTKTPVWAAGSADTNTWRDGAGDTIHSPV